MPGSFSPRWFRASFSQPFGSAWSACRDRRLRLPLAQALTVSPSAVLTAPDRIEAIAGEDVSFPIALDGTDGVPSRSVIAVKGLPQGSNFSEGRPYGDSEWSLKPDQIGDLDLVLPADANGEFKLGIALIGPDDAVIAEAETLLEITPAPAARRRPLTPDPAGAPWR